MSVYIVVGVSTYDGLPVGNDILGVFDNLLKARVCVKSYEDKFDCTSIIEHNVL